MAMSERALGTLEAVRAQLAKGVAETEERQKLEAAKVLLERCKEYSARHAFRVGDPVRWKAGLANRRRPEGDEFGVVSRVYAAPVHDANRKDAGSPYWREPLDVAVAFLDSDGEFLEFHYDSARLAPADLADCAPRALKRLRDILGRLLAPPQDPPLAPGDAVRWKEGLKNKRRPALHEPAVVLDVFPPIFDAKKEAGSQYFREPLDTRLALLDDDGELVVYHFDSRRLERVPPEEEATAFTAPADESSSSSEASSSSSSSAAGSDVD